MNLPNKITILRVFLIPFFLLAVYIKFPIHYLVSLVIFIVASITDVIDGKIARKHNLVTNFGKFIDPLADKVLVLAALAVFVELPEIHINAVPLIIIITREFMVSGLRMLVIENNIVLAAGICGKLKTTFTMITIIISLLWLSIFCDLLLDFPKIMIRVMENWLIPTFISISTVLAIISGGVYLKNYWYLINLDR